MGTLTDAKKAEALAKAAEELAKADGKKLTNKEKLKDYAIRFFGGLFMELKGEKWAISVGRCSWWMAFSPALYIWVSTLGEKDITDHHLTVLLLLAGYNFGKKVVEKFKKPAESGGPG